MKIKFNKYSIKLKNKNYTILIPKENYHHIWLSEYDCENSWMYADIKCFPTLIHIFALLSYNPYMIIYLPVKNNEYPEILNENNIADFCKLDAVYCTNRSQLKHSDWKNIRHMLKFIKPDKYEFNYNKEKILKNIEPKINEYKEVYDTMKLQFQTVIFTIHQETYFNATVQLIKDFDRCAKDEKTLYENMHTDTPEYFYGAEYIYGFSPYTRFNIYTKSNGYYRLKHINLYFSIYDIDVFNKFTESNIRFRYIKQK